MKKWFVLAVGLFMISAGLMFAGTPKASPVAFTLAPLTSDASSGSPRMSFRLAGTPGEPSAGAGPGGVGLIEDSDYPWRTAIGWYALANNTTGESNTAGGFQALQNNTTGSFNTAIGAHALETNITGYHDVAIGSQALNSNTTGGHNTATGSHTLYSNTTGFQNVANGFGTLSFNTVGNFNTATGTHALENNVDGLGNTATGISSLGMNINGHFNTALGSWAGEACIQGNYNLFLGANAKGLPEDTNTIRIGSPYAYDSNANMQTGQNQTFIAGIVETPLIAGQTPALVGITSEGRLGTFPISLLPAGPIGPTGPQGPAGEGLVSGSLLFLRSGTPPSGYVLLGTTNISLAVSGSRKPTVITVSVYQKQ